MRLDELLAWGKARLAENGIETPALDARVLLAHVSGLPVEFILSRGDESADENTTGLYRNAIEKRRGFAPVAYLTGRREFMGLDFEVNEHVLIPRPETEILTEQAVSYIKETGARRVLDLCTGSGCVGVSLARFRENLAVTASDVSAEALEVARRNAARLGVGDRVKFVRSDMFEALDMTSDGTSSGTLGGKFDLIVSNPPYIPSAEISALPAPVKNYEPRLALDGGSGGVDFYERIFAQARDFLEPGGGLFVEIGFGQGEMIRELALEYGYSLDGIVKDLEGRDRVARLRPD